MKFIMRLLLRRLLTLVEPKFDADTALSLKETQ